MRPYLDEIEKLSFHTERILRHLKGEGRYLREESMERLLESIDMRLSILKVPLIREKTRVNVTAINNMLLAIYEDLSILYRLAYKLSDERYQRLRMYTETRLRDIKESARKSVRTAKSETDRASLGKTIFIKEDGFTINSLNGVGTHSLGEVTLTKGASLAFFINGRFFDKKDTLLEVGGHHLVPYDVHNDVLTLEGAPTKASYLYMPPGDLTFFHQIPITIDGFTPSRNNRYVIYGGKDACSVTSRGIKHLFPLSKTSATTFTEEEGTISFYVKGASAISFSFSKAPIHTNINGYQVHAPKEEEYITITYEGPFSMSLDTDGTIYGEKEEGGIEKGTLFYPHGGSYAELLIEEYKIEDTITLPLSLTIVGLDTHTPPLIESIYLKEIGGYA